MNKILIIALVLSSAVLAKDWSSYITSFETSYIKDLSYNSSGLSIKVNYDYYEGKKATALLGIEMIYSKYSFPDDFPLDASFDTPTQMLISKTTSTHLNFYAGSNFYFLDSFSLIADSYLGLFLVNVKGSYENTTYGIYETENISQLFFDYGIRFGFAYDIADTLSIQVLLSKSLRTIHEDHSFIVWASGSEDAPTRINYGIKYYF